MNKFSFLPSRLTILIFLIALSILSYLFGKANNPPILSGDFWVNLSAGSVGSLITIFLIDSLIHRDRTGKLKEINRLTHKSILSMTRRLMAIQMSNFGYIGRKEVVGLLDNAEDRFKDFLVSKEYIDKFKELEIFDPKTGKFLANLEKDFRNIYRLLLDGLKELKPYPDPNIMEIITMKTPELEAKASLGEDLIDIYYKKLPRKIKNQEIKKMQPGMNVLWKMYINGLGIKTESLKYQCDSLFKLLLDIVEKTKQESLFYEVE